MPTYLFENSKGEVVEVKFSMASCPKYVKRSGDEFLPWQEGFVWDGGDIESDLYKKIVAPCQVMMPFWMQAKNDTEVVEQHRMHNEPNPANPGGKSDAQLVKEGVYRTKDMSRWV